jgi:hypothetical protein
MAERLGLRLLAKFGQGLLLHSRERSKGLTLNAQRLTLARKAGQRLLLQFREGPAKSTLHIRELAFRLQR